MNRLRSLAFWLALLGGSAAFAQSPVIQATKVTDPTTGQPLTSGSLHFGGSYSLAVTNGAITTGATIGAAGTYTLTVYNASSVALWSLSGVVVPSGGFNFDSIVIQSTQTFTFSTYPYTACAIGATGTQTNVSPNKTWTCAAINGAIQWTSIGGPSIARPSGVYVASGAPTFFCIAPCLYSQSDGFAPGQTYTLPVAAGSVSNAWVSLTSGAQIANAMNFWGGLLFSKYNPVEIRRISAYGHYVVPNIQAPALSSCGGWTLQYYSSDQTLFAGGSAGITSCTVVFRAPQGQHVFCTASPNLQSAGAIGVPNASATSTAQVFTFSNTQTGFTARCTAAR